ncbi:DUF1648 domain-containing protein [Deinococcus cellulosilyticus]|uniref:DUF1648 domain-containing protein n=1 Tax=Deinococcus cellulosilyticus (strain DSM 18568 / NBRC 106333 / KACC 11606 / 5516J-15) TaxID=1223518 RepID=A0A511N4T8_DEIC1|nr:DUF1648 domain-containing protein [Deinococcus cellulosilyticus]GEM47488.1 hypothetical protein DC3_31230 [Deinococcus cellulosilyticus NBRC 106333 = KACC 11606]
MNEFKNDLWAWLVFVLVWGYIVYSFDSLPERVPVHYNFQNVPDRYGSPAEVFVMLVVMVPYFPLLLMNATAMGVKGEQNQQTFGQLQQYARVLLLLLCSGIALGQVLTWQGILDTDAMTRMVFTMIGIFLMLMGNISPRVTRNYFSGFRTAYTLRSDLAWYDVNRKGAYLMTFCGLLVLVLTWVLPGNWPIFGLLGSVGLLFVGGARLNKRARELWEKDPRRIPLDQKPF